MQQGAKHRTLSVDRGTEYDNYPSWIRFRSSYGVLRQWDSAALCRSRVLLFSRCSFRLYLDSVWLCAASPAAQRPTSLALPLPLPLPRTDRPTGPTAISHSCLQFTSNLPGGGIDKATNKLILPLATHLRLCLSQHLPLQCFYTSPTTFILLSPLPSPIQLPDAEICQNKTLSFLRVTL